MCVFFFISAIIDVEGVKITLKVVEGMRNIFYQISLKLPKIQLLRKLMKLVFFFKKAKSKFHT